MKIVKSVVPFGESATCSFCQEELFEGTEIFCCRKGGMDLEPVICMTCYEVCFKECKDVIDERVMRKGGS